jgi:hypothetical protein
MAGAIIMAAQQTTPGVVVMDHVAGARPLVDVDEGQQEVTVALGSISRHAKSATVGAVVATTVVAIAATIISATLTTPLMTRRSARCASSQITPQLNVGIASTKTSSPTKDWLLLLIVHR